MYNTGNKNKKNTTKKLANAENAVKLSNKAMKWKIVCGLWTLFSLMNQSLVKSRESIPYWRLY